MTRLIALAPVDYSTGYGIDACQKLLGLIELGVQLFIRASRYVESKESPVPYPVQERIIHGPTADQWELLIQPPWFCPTPGKKTILCTTLEATRTTPAAIANMQKMEAIIVPSEWNRESLLEMGVNRPIFVVPESVDKMFRRHKLDPKRKMKARKFFVFGAAGNTTDTEPSRKGLQWLVDAFQAEFVNVDAVKLKIKCDSGTRIDTRSDPRIQVIAEGLSVRHLADWYYYLDTFISASCGEAWGRMLHEAMACGRPVISTIYGGQAAFEDGITFQIPHIVQNASGAYKGLGEWGVPNVEIVRKAMRAAYLASFDTLWECGTKAAKAVEKFSREKCARALYRILTDLKAWKTPRLPRPPSYYAYAYSLKNPKRKPPPEDLIIEWYRKQEPIPKLPIPSSFREKNLTNTPQGIGDTMLLTPFPGLGKKVYSKSDSFASLMYFNPKFERWHNPTDLICADRLQKRYAMGNGHFIQRLHRVFGFEVPLKPKGFLQVEGIAKVKNRVAVHLLPGGHADWQKRYIHKRAREMYDRSVKVLQKFVRGNGQYDWFEIGSKRSTWLDEAKDQTGLGLCETIRFLQSCEYFLGIISGPMHLATALGCKCIVIINFPDPEKIFLPTLKDIPLVESEWMYSQNVHLHQEKQGPLVKWLEMDTLKKAFEGGIYPFWSEKYLPLIHEKL